jgi:SagB-type dehydrogenase family enzyme
MKPLLRALSIFSLLAAIVLTSGCSQAQALLFSIGTITPTPEETPASREASLVESTPLPAPSLEGRLSLEETLAARRSLREYQDEPLSLQETGQLLWASQGITDPAGYRTAPSAGGLYPLEIYLATGEGVFQYDPAAHSLRIVKEGDSRPDLYEAAVRQESVLKAPAVFVITAVFERTGQKYGETRGPRYVYMEVGHAAQNLLLQAVALELGGVPIGAFHEAWVQEILSLPENHVPVYLIPVGRP